jgi:hemolysin activation/secretion protein/opacity protein-like surface antigen
LATQKKRFQNRHVRRGGCFLAAVVAGATQFTARAEAQAFNPTVLAPAAKLPPAREVKATIARDRKALLAPAGAENKFVTVQSVAIEGAFPELSEQNAAFARKLQGRRLSVAEIYQAAFELQAAYAKAFPLTTLIAPRPEFDGGVVRLAVIDGVIEDIEIVGASEGTQQLVRSRLEPLLGQRHLTAAEYDRRTILVGMIAGVSGVATAKPGAGDDRYVLSIGITENRVAGASVITNRLPKEFGPWEFAQALAVNNAFGFGEQISGAVSSSPDVDRFFDGTAKSQAYSVDVAIPVGIDGLAIGGGYLSARSRATPLFSPLPADLLNAGERSTGRFDRVNVKVGYPLILRSDLTLRTQVSLEHINNRNRYEPLPLGFVFPSLSLFPINDVSRDRYTVTRLGAEGSYRLPWLENATASGLILYGLGLGGRVGSDNYMFGPPLSRLYASPVFNRLNLKGRIDIGLPEQFYFSAIGRMQTSFGKPLMLPENFILDGSEAVSGYASGTLNVDRGVTARAELMRPVNLEFLGFNHVVAPYIFGAWGSGVHENRAPGQLRNIWAETFGGGLRTDTNFTDTPFGESLAIEFGRDFSNIPFRETGYRTNVSYAMRFAGNPLAPDATPASRTGVLKSGLPDAPPPLLWQGFYAGLNAGYTWDPRPAVTTLSWPAETSIDNWLMAPPSLIPFPGYWEASARGVNGQSLAAGGGFFGGGQLGFNLQVNRFVLGIETDMQGANTRTRHVLQSFNPAGILGAPWVDYAGTSIHNTKSVDWLGTTRGRVGYLITPTLLGYATGGVAYGGARASSVALQSWGGELMSAVLGVPALLQASGGAGQYSGTRAGWTIGAGLEWMFAPNASLKAEYLHYDLGSTNYAISPLATILQPLALSNVLGVNAYTQFRGDIARMGLNYHFGAGKTAETASAPPGVFTSGFYAGLNVGYGWDATPSVSSRVVPMQNTLDQALASNLGSAAALTATGALKANANGALGGGQAGYNYVLGRYVGGVEFDLQGASQQGQGGFAAIAPYTIAGAPLGTTGTSVAVEKTLDWFGTVRARAGYLITPSILAFASGGFAYGGMTLQNRVGHTTDVLPLLWAFAQSNSSVGHISTARVGWTLGGGFEWKFTPDMSLKAEYLYYDLGQANATGAITDAFRIGPASPAFVNTANVTASTRFNGQIARLGFNYHFDPTVAMQLIVK